MGKNLPIEYISVDIQGIMLIAAVILLTITPNAPLVANPIINQVAALASDPLA